MPMADPPTRHCTVAVIGAGPAGLAAATRLRELGVGAVVVLERESEAGGVPRHCGHPPFGMRELRRVLRGPVYARRLVERAEAAGVELRTATTVVAVEPGPRLILSSADGVQTLTAERVVLATGVRESSRAARLIGGQRPLGVVSVGALQGMVYLHRRQPFRRPVVVGTELVSFSALLTCRHLDMRPVAMVESGPRITAWAFARSLPMALGVPLLLGTELERIVGATRVEAVRVRDAAGIRRDIACDGVIVSGSFTPEATLARMAHIDVDAGTGGPAVDQFGRCSDSRFFATGNLLRPVETAGWSWREGVRTGDWVAACLAGRLPAADGAVRLTVGDEALRYVMPQRIVPDPSGAGMRHLQLRVARPVRGVLRARRGERVVWSQRVASLPERRLLMPLARLGTGAGDVVLELDEVG